MKILLKIIFILFVILVAGYLLLTKTTYLDFVKNWNVFKVCCINDEMQYSWGMYFLSEWY
mgnify:CR=1 FL=1